MIEVKVSDGVGNQLFQYAFGYAMSRKNNQKLVLDKSFFDFDKYRTYELDKFKLPVTETVSYMGGIASKGIIRYGQMLIRIGKKKNRLKHYTILQEHDEIPSSLKKGNFYCRGFWQSEKYFKEYRAELLNQIQLKGELSEGYYKWLAEIRGRVSVSIHIRRSDYITYRATIDAEYYQLAIKKIREYIKIDVIYYVFTDDVQWAKEYFSTSQIPINYKIVSGEDEMTDLEELMLMKNCCHHIVANSSFSWWGAWLGENEDKIVVAPEWKMWNKNFYPDDWILIKMKRENQDNKESKSTVKRKFINMIKEVGYL